MDQIIYENGKFDYNAYLYELPAETKRIMEEEDN
jgi:hypothetical protein